VADGSGMGVGVLADTAVGGGEAQEMSTAVVSTNNENNTSFI
jgi:hypothetical protein